MTKLTQIAFGRRVRIRAVGGTGAYRRRLMELGFLPGVEVMVVGAAPMGDPLHLEIRGCRFSMRRLEAEAIAISVAPVEGQRASMRSDRIAKAG